MTLGVVTKTASICVAILCISSLALFFAGYSEWSPLRPIPAALFLLASLLFYRLSVSIEEMKS